MDKEYVEFIKKAIKDKKLFELLREDEEYMKMNGKYMLPPDSRLENTPRELLPPVNSNALYALIRRCILDIATQPEIEDKYILRYKLFCELCEAAEKLIQSEKLEDAYKGIKVYYRLEDDAREEIFDEYLERVHGVRVIVSNVIAKRIDEFASTPEPYYYNEPYIKGIIISDKILNEWYGVARLIS